MNIAARTALAAAFATSAIGLVHAADVPGGKDPAGFKRYEGSQIIHHAENRYSQYLLDRDGGWSKTENAEGEIARVVYLVPEGPSALEVLRNYEQMLADAGFQQTFELKSDAVSVITSYFCEHFFFGFEKREPNSPSNIAAPRPILITPPTRGRKTARTSPSPC